MIIGVEGSSFSGKTTLANQLSQHFEAPVIREYIDYAQPEGFPDFATNDAELEKQIQYFTALEARRMRDMRSIANGAAVVVIDRTAASLIAFQKTMAETYMEHAYAWSAQRMQDKLLKSKAAGHVIQPDVVLLLTAGSEKEHMRRVSERGRIATLTALNDWFFSEKVRANTGKALRALGSTTILERTTANSLSDIIGEIEDVTS